MESLVDIQNNDTATNLKSKMEALKRFGAIDTNPRVGMEDYLTGELWLPSSEFTKAAENTNGRQPNNGRVISLKSNSVTMSISTNEF
jgi:hypothetical protein